MSRLRSLRGFLTAFALLALPLGVLAGAGVAVASRQVARGREMTATQAFGTVTTLVADGASALRREAALLARDPALIDGAAKGDWATLARYASPRIRALTRDGLADLVVVRDPAGAPLVQVPAVPPPTVPSLPALAEPAVALRVLAGEAVWLATAPVWSAEAAEGASRVRVGTVALGQRLERVGRLLGTLPGRPGVVLLAGDRMIASTRSGAPASGWARAASAGRMTIGAEPFGLRPFPRGIVDSPDGSLWALVPEHPALAVQWTLRAWLAALFSVGAITLALGIWAIVRAPGEGEPPSLGAASRPAPAREAPAPPAHEGAARAVIGRGAESGGIVASAAQETLDVVRQRLEARREIERHISEKLDLEELLVIVATSAHRLIGGAFSIVYLREGEALCPRAFTGLPDWIRDTRIPVGEGVVGTAVATGEGIIANDYQSSSLARPPFANVALRALAQPLLGAGHALGAMVIGRADTDAPFTADDLSTLADLATQAALAIDNASLFAEAKRSAAEYQALFEVAGLVSSTLDIEPLLDLVVERCRRLMGVAAAGIVKLDAAAGMFTYERGVGLSQEFVRAFRMRPGEGTSGRAGRDRAPAWSADILEDPAVDLAPDTRELVLREGFRAVLSVPILIKGEPYAVLAVYWWEPHTPSRAEIALLSALAGQAAIAIENARLYADAATHAAALDARAARLRTLARLTSTVSSSLDAGVVLDAIVKAAAEIMRSPFVCVYVADEGSAMLELRAASNEGIGAALPAQQRRVGEGLVGWVAEHRRPLEVADVLADARTGSREWVRANGLRSFLGVPIIFQDSLLGVLTLSGADPSDLGADDRDLVESFVGQAAVAIRNTRLYAEATRHLEETRAMLEVAEILNSTLDPKRVLKRVAIKIAQVCRVDRCTIERWDGDRVTPLMSQFADGRKDGRLWAAFIGQRSAPPRDVPAHAEAIATRRPVVIADTAATDLIPREWIDTFGQKSYMAVPLIRQDAVIGVMALDVVDRPHPFERGQVDLALAIAGQLALTLDNTRLYGEAQERLRETTALLAVAQALSQPGPSGEVMRRTAREISRAFGADMAGIYVLDEGKEALVPLAGYHVPKHLVPLFSTRPFVLARFPVLQEAWRGGQPFWSTDVKSDPRIDGDTFEGVDPHSVLLAPTMVRGEAVGALFMVWWGVGREFSPADIRLTRGVASQVALAMENAELSRQTQQKLEETGRLLAVSRTLASTLDLDALPRQFLRHVVDALAADTAGMWLLDEHGEWMEPVVGYHVPPSWLESLRGLRLSIVRHPVYSEAARTRRPVVVMDVMHDPRIPQEIRDGAPHGTQLFVPIITKDHIIGGFAVTWTAARRALSEGELRLMEAIASQAGVALENARLFRDNRRRVEELSVLNELARAVTGQLDHAEVLDTIAQHVARLLDARHMMIMLSNESTARLDVVLRVKDGARQDGRQRLYPRHAAGLAGVVLEGARPIRTDAYVAECGRRHVDPVPESLDLPHWLGVPMIADNRPLGVLALRSRDRAFTEGDEHVLASIADLAALALRSARLYEERTRAHGELAAAQDQLVRTEKLRAMGEMASGVAHDFNNVLAGILGRAQLLLGRVDDPKLRQWLEVIERSALDGARTVRRLQDFTRIRRDHPAVPTNLNQVVQQTLDATESSWRQEAQRRGVQIELITSFAAPIPDIPGDPAELREALTNLILNAVDAMPDGGMLGLTTTAAPDHVEIAVADTGVGIPAGIRHRIFDPFFTTKGPKGTGLGLSMTYGILARHGARISVESEEGRGATFRLLFPSVMESSEPPPPPDTPAAPARSLHCLVVDDEEIVAAVLGDMLASEGHDVEVVDSGREAIARFSAGAFDLVLTDLAMPGMTGWEVARAIKDIAPAVRVVLVSGFGVEVSPEDLEAHGVDLVLAKPLRLQDIGSVVALARSARDA
jgi:GAF domain-containing protein/ActR/RegA family two-component response regulator